MKHWKKDVVISRNSTANNKILISDIREMIIKTRQRIAPIVNSALVLLYWNIGKRIRMYILKEKRAP
jgi:hypothetical protein